MINTLGRIIRIPALILVCILFHGSGAFAQFDVPNTMVQVVPKWSRTGILPGDNVQLALQVTVAEGWHINSDQPLDEFLIPTKVEFQTPDGVTTGWVYFPEAERYQFAFSKNPVAVFQGTVHFVTTVSLAQGYIGDSLRVGGTLTYQACNDNTCLPPSTTGFSSALPVVNNSDQISFINQGLFTGTTGTNRDQGSGTGLQEARIAALLRSQGFLITLIFIFLGGLALTLTPCVYPMIPITITYFGGQAQSDTTRGTLGLAVLYILGMAVTYSLLGTIAGLTGQILGAALQNPVVLGFIALVLLVLAASMFGAFEIRVPQRLMALGGRSRRGAFGAFSMGLTLGIVAAPCIGPFVVGLLIFVGNTGNPALGFLLFFILSLGLGLPFLMLATFSGLLQKLPHSGQWLAWVRYIFGFILIGTAVYFLEPLLSDTLYRLLLGTIAFAGAAFLGAITWRQTDSTVFKVVKPVVGGLFLVAGLVLVIPGGSEGETIDWQPYSDAILRKAVQTRQPVVIDFTADWCIPCKELDKYTFSDPRVVEKSQQFVMVKADLTRSESPEVKALKQQHGVQGVPTIVFLDENGSEVRSVRLTGFEQAEPFLERMEAVLQPSQVTRK